MEGYQILGGDMYKSDALCAIRKLADRTGILEATKLDYGSCCIGEMLTWLFTDTHVSD
jgi:hypothetical protein